ncbi:MAG TPA: hypothetical protein VFN67_09960 [Polyangiales bacterium]|nr:hypothetical protein [Polyangiales bacterium]
MTAEASVDTQPGQRKKRESDQPSLDDDSDDVEPFDPGDDSDLGLDSLEDENVGLDTSLGFDESSDDLDMPELTDDEEGSWDAEADDATELPDTELDVEEDEQEYGWIDEDDSPQDDDQFTDDLDDEPEASGDDGGAEGLEDESEIDDLDLADLPELDKDSEEETGLPGLEADELAAYGLLDEPVFEIAPGVVWKMLRPRATRLTRIGWPAEARAALMSAMESADFTRSLAAHASGLFLAAGGLYRLDPQAEVFGKLPLLAAEAQQVIVAEHEGAVHVLAVARGQLLLSPNAGASFVAQPASFVTHAGFTHSAAGLRLWWRSAEGQLGSDSTIARPEGKILALHTDGRRSVAWLSRTDKLTISASADGGKSFLSWPAPAAAQSLADHELRIETCGDMLLLVAAGTLWLGAHGSELSVVTEQVREPAALIDEEGEPTLFACLERSGEWLLIRRLARSSHSAPLVLASLGPKQLGEPLALSVTYAEGGSLSAFVACQEGVLRAEVSLDGEEIA